MPETLTAAEAARLAAIALGHVEREYPNKPDHTLAGPADARTPSQLHPIFYGSYDWHSCVHSYWLLARLLRLFPDGDKALSIRALFDRAFTADKVAAECAYLAAPTARGFKRPYGWAWLLKLAAELHRLPDPRWSQTLQPLTDIFAQRYRDFLPIAPYPVRVGTHFNTAFSLRMAADYAATTGDETLLTLLRDTARRWYGDDTDCPAWGEPSGDDFLSSALIEAECMRRLLPTEEFAEWFPRFLPRLADKQPATLFTPARVTDRSDGKIAHLDGLNLSRAWCFRALATALPASQAAVLAQAAEEHYAAALPHLAGDYMGEHWLASFALLALTVAEG
ncbi:DUF2891 domain-containing protein [Roseomonas sp. 18066]|uniref:DUF2891 domain-containing protein n=1 Tax=Roseomonas sp. 18066 TaxID=2681412 RepID=UPI00135B09DD|nr:DUF2891 domain-containing protein [Roseomonas sp. 18066]